MKPTASQPASNKELYEVNRGIRLRKRGGKLRVKENIMQEPPHDADCSTGPAVMAFFFFVVPLFFQPTDSPPFFFFAELDPSL